MIERQKRGHPSELVFLTAAINYTTIPKWFVTRHATAKLMVQCWDVEFQLVELKVSKRGNAECQFVELPFYRTYKLRKYHFVDGIKCSQDKMSIL
jgi:hypothetical protein